MRKWGESERIQTLTSGTVGQRGLNPERIL